MLLDLNMVPDAGTKSNPEGSLLAEWIAKDKDFDEAKFNTLEFDEIFSTLARWNDYLENHVPYFKEANYDL